MSIKEWSEGVIHASVVIFIVIVILAIAAQTRYISLGWPPSFSNLIASGAVAIGTLMLAGSTWHTTRRTIEQMRRDREKHGRILTIANGIDPIRCKLDSYHDDWTRYGEGCYPNFEGEWQLPEDEVISDIEEAYHDVEKEFKDFIDEANEYKRAWDRLQSKLNIAIHREYYTELDKYATSNKEPAHAQISQYSDSLASYILNPEGSFSYNSYWKEFKEELIKMREREEFIDDFEKIANRYEEMVQKNQHLDERLGDARNELKSEYGATDLEVEEVNEQSPLEGPTIIKREHI